MLLRVSRWYVKLGYKWDVGFARRTDKSRYVQCLLCEAHGGGITGGYKDLMTPPQVWGWQRRHLNPHIYECACGLWFVHSQQLGAHVSANRRWKKPGHGRMDKIGCFSSSSRCN